MAMALYPSVQKQVQDEIDKVVGRDRLPTFDDRASLPHVDAVLRETLRWRLVAPLAIPHTAVKDNIYKGFYIPKGEHIMARIKYRYSYAFLFRHPGFAKCVVSSHNVTDYMS